MVHRIFRLLDGRANERSNSLGLDIIDVIASVTACIDAMRNDVRRERDGGSLAQGFDFAAVGELVTERDDVRRTTEVLSQANDTAEGDLRQFVNGCLAIIQFLIGHAFKQDTDELAQLGALNTN